jgi:predicted O-methyltransferase YrrM
MVHPFFAWAGLRPLMAQHTEAEHQALEEHAYGCKSLVEIGVAEGASALALRSAMDPKGTLYLIDPFHLSRVPKLNFLRRAARRAVSGKTFSHEAVRGWDRPIDFLLIDGDHREEAVEQDWNDWTPHVVRDGIIVLHDARLFPGGWTSEDYGPVRFVNRMFRRDSSPEWTIQREIDSLVVIRRKGVTRNADAGN